MFKSNLRKRVIATSLLLIFVFQLIAPTITFALTSGPHQQEFTSYEEPGTTDMVNLLTGDFTYNLPILDIPGPESSFSIPLTYHSGAGTEQESSWVGLGFSLNPGAIVRNVVEYPDDANGENLQIHKEDPDVVKGWSSGLLGFGNIGWNSATGHYGTVSLLSILGASYKNGNINDFAVVGVHFSGGDVSANYVEVASAVMTIASFGAGAAAAPAGTAAKSVATDAAISVGLSVAMSLAFDGTPDFNSGGYWALNKDTDRRLFHKNYWYWLDATRYEDMYGILNLGEMPTVDGQVGGTTMPTVINDAGQEVSAPVYVEPLSYQDKSAGSDMHMDWDGNQNGYWEHFNPTSLSKDSYSVMGPGISGSIEPYRLDVGSLAMPRKMTQQQFRIAYPKFLNNYKVPFRYRGSHSNSYYQHAGIDATGNVDLDNTQFGVQYSVATEDANENRKLVYELTDDVLKTKRIEQDRYGLDNSELAQARHIEWYTNNELKNPPSEFVDFLESTSREQFRSSMNSSTKVITRDSNWDDGVDVGQENGKYFNIGDVVRIYGTYTYQSGEHGSYFSESFDKIANVTGKDGSIITFDIPNPANEPINPYYSIDVRKTPIPESSIGGYSITKEDGTTYHYALPVFSWNNYSWVANKADQTEQTEFLKSDPFANSWLLTSITGSDYIDRNNNNQIDDADWGAWIKFEYGRYSDNYTWRIPYSGYTISADQQTVSYSTGKKQQYYLNSISTRSHTALFIKNKKNDGKGIQNQYQTSSSLRLDEIVLLKNEDYNKLITPSSEGGLGAGKNSNSEEEEISIVGTGATSKSLTESYTDVWDQFDVNRTPGIKAFLKEKGLKTIKFNHSYRLCSNTPNAYQPALTPSAERQGKLTLESVAMYGPNDFKLMPDYLFDYGYNPPYDRENWDGWGAYNPNGLAQNHQANNNPIHGAAWQLSEITSPIGSKMIIDYERDSYSSISGYDPEVRIKASAFNSSTGQMTFDINAAGITDLREIFQEGQTITLKSGAQQMCLCWDSFGANSWFCTYDYIFPESQTISGLTANSFTLSSWPGFVNEYNDGANGREACGLKNLNDTYILDPRDKKGGNARVAAISIKDENDNIYKTRYIYTQDGTPTGKSSGVVGQEPEYAKTQEFDFYNLYNYPSTPVLYGKTTVLKGKLTTDDDFNTRQVFEFKTPHWSMVNVASREDIPTDGIAHYVAEKHVFGHDEFVFEILKGMSFAINIRTASIGQLQSIRTYDAKNNLKASTNLEYTSDLENKQGVFTEGTMLIEKTGDNGNKNYGHKILRTNKTIFPSILKAVTTTTENYSTVATNKKWDFITGSIVESESQNSLGISYRSVVVPAYTIYPELGPKSVNNTNKHMLNQVAATYNYKLDGTGNPVGLVSAGIQTWSKAWNNYRTFNPATVEYENETSSIPVWRHHKNYVWNSTERNGDGTLKNFIDFIWTVEEQDNRWINVSEMLRYDHYSMPLESQDLNGEHSATKMGYNNTLPLLSGSFSKYTELAYSGAEDKIEISPGIFHFGSEIQGADKQDATYHHTGNYAIKLLSSETGFTYKARVGTEVETGRKYRASAWVHKSDLGSNGGQLYAEVNGALLEEVVNIASTSTKQAGDWYLLNLYFEIEAAMNGQLLTVGCKNTGTSTVYFDDFRFHPLETPVTTFVYDPHTHQVTYTLDNDNLFTRFEYDHAGRLVKTYREVIGSQPEKLITHNQYNFARMKSAQWQDTGNLRCVIGSDGGNTGEQEKEQRDMNTESSTSNLVRWISIGANQQACPPCVGENKKIINGVCESGTRENVNTYQSGEGSYTCQYQYVFSDGSTTGIFYEVNDYPCTVSN